MRRRIGEVEFEEEVTGTQDLGVEAGPLEVEEHLGLIDRPGYPWAELEVTAGRLTVADAGAGAVRLVVGVGVPRTEVGSGVPVRVSFGAMLGAVFGAMGFPTFRDVGLPSRRIGQGVVVRAWLRPIGVRTGRPPEDGDHDGCQEPSCHRGA